MNLDSQLTQLEFAQLVRHVDGKETTFIFKHVLTQEAAYSSLLLRDRKHLHYLVAQVLELQYANHLDFVAAQLANHFQQAEEFDLSYRYYLLAGDASARVYANAEAHTHYEHAFQTLIDLPQTDVRIRREADALIKLVSVSTIIDTPENNLACLARAEALSQRLAQAESNDEQRWGQIYFWRGFLNMLRGELEMSNTAYQHTIELANGCHDSQLVANASFDMGINLNFQGQFGHSAAQMTQAIRLLEQSGKALEDVNALAHLGYALIAQGHDAEGIAKIQQGLASAQSRENPFGMATCLMVLALAYQMENDAPKMLETAQKVVQIAERFGIVFWILAGYTIQAWANSRLGNHAVARSQLAKAQTLSRQFNMPLFGGGLLNAIRAEIAFNARQFDEALIAVEKTIACARPVRGLLAEAMAQRVWAQAIAALHPSYYTEIDMHMTESIRLLEMGDAQLEVARTHTEWGKLLRERGALDAAREHYEKAAMQFQASGLEHNLAQTQDLLREADIAH